MSLHGSSATNATEAVSRALNLPGELFQKIFGEFTLDELRDYYLRHPEDVERLTSSLGEHTLRNIFSDITVSFGELGQLATLFGTSIGEKIEPMIKKLTMRGIGSSDEAEVALVRRQRTDGGSLDRMRDAKWVEEIETYPDAQQRISGYVQARQAPRPDAASRTVPPSVFSALEDLTVDYCDLDRAGSGKHTIYHHYDTDLAAVRPRVALPSHAASRGNDTEASGGEGSLRRYTQRYRQQCSGPAMMELLAALPPTCQTRILPGGVNSEIAVSSLQTTPAGSRAPKAIEVLGVALGSGIPLSLGLRLAGAGPSNDEQQGPERRAIPIDVLAFLCDHPKDSQGLADIIESVSKELNKDDVRDWISTHGLDLTFRVQSLARRVTGTRDLLIEKSLHGYNLNPPPEMKALTDELKTIQSARADSDRSAPPCQVQIEPMSFTQQEAWDQNFKSEVESVRARDGIRFATLAEN